MSDAPNGSPSPASGPGAPQSSSLAVPGPGNANLVYILYLIGPVIGVTSLIGVVMAYINRDKVDGWVRSHYDFQIQTFWKGILFAVIGFVTMAIVIGAFVLLFALVWVIVRCVKGMSYIAQQKPVPNPSDWMFG